MQETFLRPLRQGAAPEKRKLSNPALRSQEVRPISRNLRPSASKNSCKHNSPGPAQIPSPVNLAWKPQNSRRKRRLYSKQCALFKRAFKKPFFKLLFLLGSKTIEAAISRESAPLKLALWGFNRIEKGNSRLANFLRFLASAESKQQPLPLAVKLRAKKQAVKRRRQYGIVVGKPKHLWRLDEKKRLELSGD